MCQSKGQPDRRGNAGCVGVAVGLYDGAVEAQKDTAIDPARVDPAAEAAQRGQGKERADARQRGVAKGLRQQAPHERGGALGGFQRDIAGKAVGDDDIDPV